MYSKITTKIQDFLHATAAIKGGITDAADSVKRERAYDFDL